MHTRPQAFALSCISEDLHCVVASVRMPFLLGEQINAVQQQATGFLVARWLLWKGLFTPCSCPLSCSQQLVKRKEESMEVGGYFICNGLERIIRMLIQQRRHYIMALRRSAYQKRGSAFTDAATLLR